MAIDVVEIKPRTASSPYRPSWPLAAILLSLIAQGVLAAVIAAERVSPIAGAMTAVGLAICGLVIVAAQAFANGRRR